MISTRAMQGYFELMQNLNVNSQPLLEKNKIELSQLSNSDGFIEISSLIHILEDSAVATDCADFGLQLMRFQQHDMLGIYLLILRNTSTVQQLIEDASRYLFLHSPNMKLVFDETISQFENSVTLYFDINLPEFFSQRQMIDGCLARIFLMCTQQFKIPVAYIKAVSLPHTPLASKFQYQKFFQVPVHFEQPYSAIHFDKCILNWKLPPINPDIHEYLIQEISKQYSLLEIPKLTERVESLIRATIGLNPIKKTEVATLLNLHPRTLQRWLAAEDTSFEIIKEKVYKQISLNYLIETGLPIFQISNILGFSESSIFTRACYRWHKKSPKEIRASQK